MYRIKVLINGRVQGVGFRYFICTLASRFNLTGFVKNLDNGDVYLEAQGSKENLEEFTVLLKEGNKFSTVLGVDIDKTDIVPSEHKFKIKY